jgi:hypothetical protein
MSRRICAEKAPINFLFPEHINYHAARLARPIFLDCVHGRFIKLVVKALRADPRNARPPSAEDMRAAPDWARDSQAQGREVMTFRPNTVATRPLRATARALAEACEEAVYYACMPREALSDKAWASAQMAYALVTKAKRMDLKSLSKHAEAVKRARQIRLSEIELFPRETIDATSDRVWERVCSIGALGALGCAMQNCLANRSSFHGRYATWLRDDKARFWALRDPNGKNLMAVMVDTASQRVLEARGFRNAPVSSDNADLAALLRARGLTLDTVEAQLQRINHLAENARPRSRRSDALRASLRRAYEETIQAESVPERLQHLLDQISQDPPSRSQI